MEWLPEFKNVWILLLIIPIIPYIYFLYDNKKRKGRIKFSTIKKFKKIKPGFKYKLRKITLFLRMIAVILIIVSLARPRKGKQIKYKLTEGIAIQMVIDKSGSMNELMNYDNNKLTRIEVAKKVFAEFVKGELLDDKNTMKNNLVGITSFAGLVEFNCPLTLDHSNFEKFLNQINVFDYKQKLREINRSLTNQEIQSFKRFATLSTNTAIGDALYYTCLKIIEADKYYKNNDNYKIKSKIVILLTDGKNNYGQFNPMEAAELAKSNNIKVYTIGIGSERGGRYQEHPIFGKIFVGTGSSEVDEQTLEQIADMTGGKFYFADDAESLRNIYKDIAKLEKSKFKDLSYIEYNELYRYFLIPAIILLIIEIILSTTVFRRIP